MTWPLAAGITRDVAWDLGDPVLNMWILAWDCEQFRGILQGHYSHLRHFFDANIFHPAPLTLAYSEHLVPQAIQIFPVYALTKNPILCYNLLFLSTFVLSGVGMFLFARELTGSTAAAFVAGLLFGFAPYRIPQSSHLQVLSSQWMPFAMYGFRRFFEGGRTRALAGGTAAVVLQGLSSGYYLLYFSPFALGYVLWEMWRNDRLSDRRTWFALSAAAAVAAVVVAPFVVRTFAPAGSWSYRDRCRKRRGCRRMSTPTPPRRRPNASGVSGLRTHFQNGRASCFPEQCPCCSRSLAYWQRHAHRANPSPAPHARSSPTAVGDRRATRRCSSGDHRVPPSDHRCLAVRRAPGERYAAPSARRDRVRHRALPITGDACARGGVYALQRIFRARPHCRSLVVAWTLSAGAWKAAGSRIAVPILWTYVPGLEGLRVPARFAMIVALMVAVLGALGGATVARIRHGVMVLGVLAALFLYEAAAAPFVVNGMTPVKGFATPAARLDLPERAPVVYRAVDQLPADAVIADLPLGEPDYDLRAMYYSIERWRPLVNGYSGFFPPHYGRVRSRSPK
jgi:hypothetical protein